MEDQNINEKDVKHLQWLYDRMVNVHGENKDYDYMIKFKEIIKQQKKYTFIPNSKTSRTQSDMVDMIIDRNGKRQKL
jgi:hypothetical protein